MISLLSLFVLAAAPLVQQTSPPQESASALGPKTQSLASKTPARIQWFGTLEQGLAEAKRTNRPLLMTAAAPSCRGIAGMW
jgi:hypothetical protein